MKVLDQPSYTFLCLSENCVIFPWFVLKFKRLLRMQQNCVILSSSVQEKIIILVCISRKSLLVIVLLL